jgi:hypothetical protein
MRPSPFAASALPAAAADIAFFGASYATTLHAHKGEAELVRFRFVNATTDLDTSPNR